MIANFALFRQNCFVVKISCHRAPVESTSVTIYRVTIRPAFCFSQTEEFRHRCSNFIIGQAGNDDFWSDLQKKKRSITCLDAGFVQFSA